MNQKEKMDLVMIQFLFHQKKKTFGQMMPYLKNIKWIIDLKLLKKLKNFFKFTILLFDKNLICD